MRATISLALAKLIVFSELLAVKSTMTSSASFTSASTLLQAPANNAVSATSAPGSTVCSPTESNQPMPTNPFVTPYSRRSPPAGLQPNSHHNHRRNVSDSSAFVNVQSQGTLSTQAPSTSYQAQPASAKGLNPFEDNYLEDVAFGHEFDDIRQRTQPGT